MHSNSGVSYALRPSFNSVTTFPELPADRQCTDSGRRYKEAGITSLLNDLLISEER